MKTEEIIEIVDNYLNEIPDNKESYILRIKEIQDFLSYSLRVAELTEAELIAFGKTMQGGHLSDNMRDTLNSCETEEKKNHYIEMWARSEYFKQCAWMSYLHGETPEKPFIVQ